MSAMVDLSGGFPVVKHEKNLEIILDNVNFRVTME